MADSLELTPEELVARMTDEDVLGLTFTPPSSRPGSGGTTRGKRTGLSALVPKASDASDAGSRRPSGTPSKEEVGKARQQLAQSASAPIVGTLRPVTAAEVKAQRTESFHFKHQRRWLELRNKQHCLSFTEQEISDFRRFFDALAKGKPAIPLDRFEDMLVCCDLAKSRKDVRGFLEVIHDNIVNDEIYFKDFLRAFESQLQTRSNPHGTASMDVLKLLLQGKYDSRDLDFLTFISERRRELIFAATGARGTEKQGPSSQIVRTFADLLEDRCYLDFGGGASGKPANEDGLSTMAQLGTHWQMACVQHGLARTMTAEERSAHYKKSLPLSPRTVVNNIIKTTNPKPQGVRRMGTTLIIDADSINV